MAYAVPSANRIEYDRDGTRVFFIKQSNLTIAELSGAQLTNLNDETSNATGLNGNDTPIGYRPGASWMVWMFSTPMSISHAAIVSSNMTSWSYSSNTTDGNDGTWTTVTMPNTTVDVSTSYRTVTALSGGTITNVKAIRVASNWGDGNAWINAAHFYGNPTSTPEALQIWHPTLNQRAAGTDMDMGVIASSGTGTLSFRVKNVGASYSASNIIVSAAGSTNSSYAALAEFSLDGSSWSSTVNIGNLPPGTISSVVQMRMTVGTSPTVGPKSFSILATPS